MKCYNCGNPIETDVSVCPGCGKAVFLTDELLQAALKHHRSAFEDIYKMSYGTVYSVVYPRVSQKEDVPDLIQEIYVKVYKGLSVLKSARAFNGWIKKVAANTVTDYLRSRQSLEANNTVFFSSFEKDDEAPYDPGIEEPAAESIPEKSMELSEAREIIDSCLSELPEPLKSVTTMYFLNQLTSSEIASSLNTNENTVKTWIRRGRNQLSASIKKRGYTLYAGAPVTAIIMAAAIIRENIRPSDDILQAVLKAAEPIPASGTQAAPSSSADPSAPAKPSSPIRPSASTNPAVPAKNPSGGFASKKTLKGAVSAAGKLSGKKAAAIIAAAIIGGGVTAAGIILGVGFSNIEKKNAESEVVKELSEAEKAALTPTAVPTPTEALKPTPEITKEAETPKEPEVKTPFDNAAIGDIVVFGSYEQDNDLNNGNEPIEWIVLDANENEVLLLSQKVLYGTGYLYDFRSFDASWSNSDVRHTLQKFYDTAFTDSEKEKILDSEIDGSIDKCIILSEDEVLKYLPENEQRISTLTKYAFELGLTAYDPADNTKHQPDKVTQYNKEKYLYEEEGVQNTYNDTLITDWFILSYKYVDHFGTVWINGSIGEAGIPSAATGVRPAIRVSTASVSPANGNNSYTVDFNYVDNYPTEYAEITAYKDGTEIWHKTTEIHTGSENQPVTEYGLKNTLYCYLDMPYVIGVDVSNGNEVFRIKTDYFTTTGDFDDEGNLIIIEHTGLLSKIDPKGNIVSSARLTTGAFEGYYDFWDLSINGNKATVKAVAPTSTGGLKGAILEVDLNDFSVNEIGRYY